MIRTISICLVVLGAAGAAYAATPEQHPVAKPAETPSTLLAHSILSAEDLGCRLEATAVPSRSQQTRLADLVRQHRVVSRLSLSQDSLPEPGPVPARERPDGSCS